MIRLIYGGRNFGVRKRVRKELNMKFESYVYYI